MVQIRAIDRNTYNQLVRLSIEQLSRYTWIDSTGNSSLIHNSLPLYVEPCSFPKARRLQLLCAHSMRVGGFASFGFGGRISLHKVHAGKALNVNTRRTCYIITGPFRATSQFTNQLHTSKYNYTCAAHHQHQGLGLGPHSS